MHVRGFCWLFLSLLPLARADHTTEAISFPLTIGYRYLLALPSGYECDEGARWPLVVFLHGMGARGDKIEAVKKEGLAKLVDEGKTFPFILVSPQCAPGEHWSAAALDAFVDRLTRKYRVDPDRVYLTGLSMGGYGVWAAAQRNPFRYAAVVPICGGGDPRQAARLRDLPVWAFHGARDTTVPLWESERMIDAIKAAGGEPRFTVFPEAGHDCWTETYANPELYTWLLAQKRSPERAIAARWRPRVDRYLERDQFEPPPIGGVVFAGSSSIDMWTTLSVDFPGLPIVNRGIGGSWLSHLPEYAPQLILPLRPTTVVVYAGENDLQHNMTVDQVVDAFERVRAQLYAADPAVRLIFLALKPSPRRRALLSRMQEANVRIAAACEGDPRCTFVDVFTPMLDASGEPRAELFLEDQLHMNVEGYRLWTSLVAPVLAAQ